ncbi:MAG: undecaprenyldiphospho-muramoylpentapeptide beta-N-acetylglucosaminyltransferase [Acutalibacteraceae bacterium]|nr:undecaprenyldiphospho-muramoylpentapeptide beta-N-acetylglucosaminyltransferase [Acutalibacteraceae bacterium]
MHILFAGGGTAGHINPALAVADYIKEKHPDAKISFIGTKDRLEAKLVPEKNYHFYSIKVQGFRRSLSPSGIIHNVKTVAYVMSSSVKVRKLLKELKPDVVVGTGGYVSGPVLSEAVKLGIKTAIHEQNAFPGVTNKMLSQKVDRVMLAMPEAESRMKFKNNPYLTGNPVRKELTEISKTEAKAKLGFDERPVLLSFGGSLGAEKINNAAVTIIKELSSKGEFYHIHGTGKSGYETVKNSLGGLIEKETVDVREYIKDMDVCMAAADLIICRAGAITLSELAVCRKPSILIPSPYVAENHQYHNAFTLKNAGAAEIIEEKDLTNEKIIETVDKLICNKEKLRDMSKNADKVAIDDSKERIYNIIMDLLN